MADTATPTHRRTALTWGDGCTALTAVIVGVFGAFSYYGDTVLRPFAHTFGIWILLVSVVSARQSVLCGAIRGGLALLTSVVSFFYGKQIYYDILYPGPGFPYRAQRRARSCRGIRRHHVVLPRCAHRKARQRERRNAAR